jgi:hypothetical protein
MGTQFWSGHWRGKRPAGNPHERSREVVRSTGGIFRGKFPSRKNGRMVHHEGLLELDAIYLFETSPRIAAYREQPDGFRYPDGEKLRRYTPDFELTLVTGDIVLVEVKPAGRLQEPDTRHKFQCVSQHFDRIGKRFEIFTEGTLRAQPRQSNVRTIYHRASKNALSIDALSMALDRHRGKFPMTLDTAAKLLGAGAVTPYCLLLVGLLRCELTQLLTETTQLELPEDCTHEDLLSQSGLGF